MLLKIATTTVKNEENKQKPSIWKILFNVSTIINLLIFLSLMLLIIILTPTTINEYFNINNSGWKFYSSKIYLILILILLIINATLLTFIAWQKNAAIINDNIVIATLLAIFSINFYALGYNLVNYYQSQKLREFTFFKKQFLIELKSKLGIKKWLTVDYVMIATFSALTITCAFIEGNLLPHLPYGGGMALKYIPLMIISFTISFAAGWLTGMISALMSLLFISAGNIISPWSFILDYFLPMTTPAIVGLMRFNLKNNKSIFTYINYFLHCFLVCLIIYFWQTLSGYFIWVQLYPNSVWSGYNPILYTLIYNFIHIFLFTYPLMQITIPFIYRTIVSHYVDKMR